MTRLQDKVNSTEPGEQGSAKADESDSEIRILGRLSGGLTMFSLECDRHSQHPGTLCQAGTLLAARHVNRDSTQR